MRAFKRKGLNGSTELEGAGLPAAAAIPAPASPTGRVARRRRHRRSPTSASLPGHARRRGSPAPALSPRQSPAADTGNGAPPLCQGREVAPPWWTLPRRRGGASPLVTWRSTSGSPSASWAASRRSVVGCPSGRAAGPRGGQLPCRFGAGLAPGRAPGGEAAASAGVARRGRAWGRLAAPVRPGGRAGGGCSGQICRRRARRAALLEAAKPVTLRAACWGHGPNVSCRFILLGSFSCSRMEKENTRRWSWPNLWVKEYLIHRSTRCCHLWISGFVPSESSAWLVCIELSVRKKKPRRFPVSPFSTYVSLSLLLKSSSWLADFACMNCLGIHQFSAGVKRQNSFLVRHVLLTTVS